jgi:hypothetical protein
MWFGLFVILTMLPVSVYSSYAHDAHIAPAGEYNVILRKT